MNRTQPSQFQAAACGQIQATGLQLVSTQRPTQLGAVRRGRRRWRRRRVFGAERDQVAAMEWAHAGPAKIVADTVGRDNQKR